jgi:Family of unknown function (DUF5763)
LADFLQCRAIQKNGQRCRYTGKYEGFCGRHSPQHFRKLLKKGKKAAEIIVTLSVIWEAIQVVIKHFPTHGLIHFQLIVPNAAPTIKEIQEEEAVKFLLLYQTFSNQQRGQLFTFLHQQGIRLTQEEFENFLS